jgi:TolA-binding protein
MDAVTYPETRVQKALNEGFVPVKVNFKEQADQAQALDAVWTPTFQFRAADGRLARSTSGYLAPEAFLTELAIGRGLVAVLERRFADAESAMREAVQVTPASVQTPEALYWLAVTRYKTSGKPDGLMETWNELLDRFPQTTWAMRASFIREGTPKK